MIEARLKLIPIRSDAFCVREIGDETILFGEEGNEIHCLDEVGSLLWESIDGNRSIEELVRCVTADYEVTPEVAEQDVVRFITELAEKGVVSLQTRSP